jgi:septal ring factor EnvC (AmiA/AmiB activator)
MDQYSVIVVGNETAPVRRFTVDKNMLKRALGTVAAVVAMLVIASVDYVNVRMEHGDLPGLRVEVSEQQAQIDAFEKKLSEVKSQLRQIGEFERKVRIIANLPGAAGTGGEEVSEVLPEDTTQPNHAGSDSTSASTTSETGIPLVNPAEQELPIPIGPQAASGAGVEANLRDAHQLRQLAENRQKSLAMLADQLVSKRDRLASTPAIWPAKGWLTSRFGSRVSPFTNRQQFHAGIDIAGERGTDVVASAKGKVVFSGKRGPLGNSVIIDHGHGIRTMYGHSEDLFVKRGETVERGQRIASLGSSGRSTGPHVHYVVEQKGKAVNPLNYIFD